MNKNCTNQALKFHPFTVMANPSTKISLSSATAFIGIQRDKDTIEESSHKALKS